MMRIANLEHHQFIITEFLASDGKLIIGLSNSADVQANRPRNLNNLDPAHDILQLFVGSVSRTVEMQHANQYSDLKINARGDMPDVKFYRLTAVRQNNISFVVPSRSYFVTDTRHHFEHPKYMFLGGFWAHCMDSRTSKPDTFNFKLIIRFSL